MKEIFKHGEFYTRVEISNLIGGDPVSFLPSKNKTIICGCFNLAKNPEAPKVILAGKNPNVKKRADLFSDSHNYIPIFIKRATNQWEYVGKWKFKRELSDPTAIKTAFKLGKRGIDSIYKAIELTQ